MSDGPCKCIYLEIDIDKHGRDWSRCSICGKPRDPEFREYIDRQKARKHQNLHGPALPGAVVSTKLYYRLQKPAAEAIEEAKTDGRLRFGKGKGYGARIPGEGPKQRPRHPQPGLSKYTTRGPHYSEGV